MCCVAKIYSSVINARIQKFIEENELKTTLLLDKTLILDDPGKSWIMLSDMFLNSQCQCFVEVWLKYRYD